MSVKVKNKDGLIGLINIENWANPKTYWLDFIQENGDTQVEERDNLEYLGVEDL